VTAARLEREKTPRKICARNRAREGWTKRAHSKNSFRIALEEDASSYFRRFLADIVFAFPSFPHTDFISALEEKSTVRGFLILEEKQRRARATKRRDAKDIIAPTHRSRIKKIYAYLPIYVREFLL
jgi:hypothetical protein